jgi:hypothetical protein
MLRCTNYGVIAIKPGYQTTGSVGAIWSDESSSTLFSSSVRVCVWRTPKQAYNLERLVPTVKHGRGRVMVWAAVSWYTILLVSLLYFMAELLQGVRGQVG